MKSNEEILLDVPIDEIGIIIYTITEVYSAMSAAREDEREMVEGEFAE